MRLILATLLVFTSCGYGYFREATIATDTPRADLERAGHVAGEIFRVHSMHGTKRREYQIWFEVETDSIAAFCTERTLPVWRFSRCKSPEIRMLLANELGMVRGD